MGAREYDPAIGRFVQPDTIVPEPGNPQTLNRYSYAFHNPLRYTDPTGHDGWDTLNTIGAFSDGFAREYAANQAWFLPQAREALSPRQDESTAGTIGRIAADLVSMGQGFGEGVTGVGGITAGALGCGTGVLCIVGAPAIVVSGALVAQGVGSAVSSAANLGSNTANLISKMNKGAEFRSFKSFDELKKELGPAGENKVWHHIVEQRKANVERFGAEAIHNTRNVVPVSREINQLIANYYSRIRPFTNGLTVREWLNAQSYEEQFEFGQRVLRAVESGVELP